LLIAILLALPACTLANSDVSPPAASTSTIPPVPTVAPLTSTKQAEPTASPPLETTTGPYSNQAALLDGVCFEYLYTLDGQTWVWTTDDDLAAFYGRVDRSELCPAIIARGAFEFDQQVLIGAVSVATGCDAAYRVGELVQDDTTRVQTLPVTLVVQPGCDYELVEPLLIAVPAPPAGYSIEIGVAGP